MKKMLFISLPMRDRSEDEIQKEQQELFNYYKHRHPDQDVQLINPYHVPSKQILMSDMVGHSDVKMLGESISLLSYADVVLFAKGWENYPGCRIEHKVCTYYDMKVEHVS